MEQPLILVASWHAVPCALRSAQLAQLELSLSPWVSRIRWLWAKATRWRIASLQEILKLGWVKNKYFPTSLSYRPDTRYMLSLTLLSKNSLNNQKASCSTPFAASFSEAAFLKRGRVGPVRRRFATQCLCAWTPKWLCGRPWSNPNEPCLSARGCCCVCHRVIVGSCGKWWTQGSCSSPPKELLPTRTTNNPLEIWKCLRNITADENRRNPKKGIYLFCLNPERLRANRLPHLSKPGNHPGTIQNPPSKTQEPNQNTPGNC